VASANEMNVPADWSLSAGEIGYEWIDGSRAARIEEVLYSQPQHSVEAACALQTDMLSLPARRLLRLLDAAGGDHAAVSHALRVLAGWDAVLSADSGAAALFEVWWSKHLRPALFAAATSDKTVHALLAPGDAETALGRLEAAEGWFAAPALVHRDALLWDSLAKAYDECAARMGGDVAKWAWGRLHHGFFGPHSMGGGDSTPMNATYRPTDFRVVLGATFRIVIDVGGWDNSRCINAPGQSGDVRSPHYSDLAERWSRGEYVPLLYSREAIAAAAEYELRLQSENA
jgi:penicillin amidase